MRDALFLIAMLACLLAPPIYLKLWYWVATMGAIALVVLVIEGIAVLRTGKTISQKFWAFSKENRKKAWVILGVWSFAWGILVLHLAWKMLTE